MTDKRTQENKGWMKFSRSTAQGEVFNFRIENHMKADYPDILTLIEEYFVKEEVTHVAAGLPNRTEAMEEMREFLQISYHNKSAHIVVCRLEGSEQIVAVSVMCLERQEDDHRIHFKAKTKEMQKLLAVFSSTYSRYNIFEKLNVDLVYDDRCVVVHQDFRGLGIAKELFHSRRLICKEHSVPVTGAWMTSIGSQIAAKRDGWETVYEIDYKKLGEEENIVFKNAPEKCIFMIARPE